MGADGGRCGAPDDAALVIVSVRKLCERAGYGYVETWLISGMPPASPRDQSSSHQKGAAPISAHRHSSWHSFSPSARNMIGSLLIAVSGLVLGPAHPVHITRSALGAPRPLASKFLMAAEATEEATPKAAM